MTNETTTAIIKRFFTALDTLKRERVIRGKQTFTSIYGINSRNFYLVESGISVNQFYPCYINYIVTGFKVSADWLITGRGNMFEDGWDADRLRMHLGNGKPIDKNYKPLCDIPAQK